MILVSRAVPIVRVVLLGCCLALASVALAEGPKRKVKIPWRAIEDASSYEIEIAEDPEMDPLLDTKKTQNPEVTLQLPPGSYYFRVRGIDDEAKPGPWSEVQGFTVHGKPPEPLEPSPNQVVKEEIPEKGLRFTWKSSQKDGPVRLEIQDERGTILNRGVRGGEHFWKPEKPGKYQWRVGFETVVGLEWSGLRSFTLLPGSVKVIKPEEPQALPNAKLPTVSDAFSEEFIREEKSSRNSEFWVLARFAQSVVAYTIDDQDLAINASGAALAGAYSIEGRWRGPKKPMQTWTWSGSINLEALRQTVLGTTFTLPRVYARVFYGNERNRWRVGPFLHFQTGKSGIFIAESATQARSGTVSRVGLGLGGVAVYRPVPTLGLSLLAMIRNDSGGTSSAIPSPLSSSMAFEAGFGAGLALGPDTMLEGRIRALQESFQWTATAGGQSSLSNLFLLIDLGIGLKF